MRESSNILAMQQWMIYGANGYTGELIAREAVRRGMKPVLAGRSAKKIEPLARELGLEWRAFDVEHADLRGMTLVLHCAGPFVHTSGPMVRACLAQGAHYLDITGEIGVFESVFRRDAEAKERGVTLLPGVGFDVVPTDCLAARLSQRLPDAEELWLAFFSHRGGISPGTAKTSIEGAAKGGWIRRDGKLTRVPILFDVREIPFSIGNRLCVTIPWGDLATAWRSTGIPNIRVYTGRSKKSIDQLRRTQRFLPLLRFTPVRRFAQFLAGRRPGPGPEQRAAARVYLWGRVARGSEEVTMTMDVAEGYTFTVLSSLAAVERLLGGAARPGAWTPAQLFGVDFVDTIDKSHS
jgi:short subunit dehydrogenase-like uncharacterized protein